MEQRDIDYSDLVSEVLEIEGITPQELASMVSKAAISSHRGAHRRYHHWFFVMSAGGAYVKKMFKEFASDAQVRSWRTHADCHGVGCQVCGWSGEVPN